VITTPSAEPVERRFAVVGSTLVDPPVRMLGFLSYVDTLKSVVGDKAPSVKVHDTPVATVAQFGFFDGSVEIAVLSIVVPFCEEVTATLSVDVETYCGFRLETPRFNEALWRAAAVLFGISKRTETWPFFEGVTTGVFVTGETAGILAMELPAPEQPVKSIADKAIPPMVVRLR
jgi:hypothetical protein